MSNKHKTGYENTNLNNFSFVHHKHVFNPFIRGFHDNDCVIETLSDFWAFVAKYENLLRSSGRPILPDPLKLKATSEFHSQKYLFTNFNIDISRIVHCVPEHKKFRDIKYKAEQFLEIALIYLDFKQKEKFKKLRKLRKTRTSLPVFEYKEKIQRAITDHQVLILAGDTGCGKSTQIPQYLNDMGYKNIACTQPRRLACLSLSKRVAHEMLEDYGSKVGYQIRFERNKTIRTEICFITEGLLLRQLASDENIFYYDVLILDEIHERNLHGDILLGVVKCLVKARRDLKVILMSATINVELFTNYFREEDCLYIEVPGRLHPIKTFYMPQMGLEFKSSGKSKTNLIDPSPYIKILTLIDNKYDKEERGDVLIFVSGANEINNLVEAAKQYNETSNNWIILPLHSGLSLADQDKVFDYAPDNFRKCIISTNIAETSLTIDGVRFVVDSGKVKEMSFDPICKIQKLKEFWVSKSSAEQRKGRAGRTGPGICYRLYTSNDFDNFDAFPTPEIHRVQLESILLQMVSMGLPNVRTFPFIERPVCANIERAVLILKQHDALTADEKITMLGKALAGIPVEISIGKMLLMSCAFRELNRALLFTAMLSVQSPYTNRAFNDPKCERSRSSYISDQGDIFTIMDLYNEWLQLKQNQKENTRKWCYDVGIEEQRFYEMTKLRNQFESVLENCNVIRKTSQEHVSSTERAIRYGEVKMLKAMKRKQVAETSSKRKILKTDDTGENFDNTTDIRDVDFRLRNNFNQIQALVKASKTGKLKNILLMKLIIASGFYPQISIADELNFCQAEHKQFFHTISKQFVSIHPNSDMIKHLDILRLKEGDIEEKPHYFKSKLPLSSVHQILCYQNLLETSKPYLLNAIRMQAAPTLLLFSFVIETDSLISKIVCDSWLCLEFPTPGSGQEFLLRAVTLRKMWLKLMFSKLQDNEQTGSLKKNVQKDFAEDDLLDELVSFINLSIPYTIKRLLNADLKDLYTHNAISSDDFIPNPFDSEFEVKENNEKGGLCVTNNVVYGCLRDSSWSMSMEEEAKQCQWKCKDCGKIIYLSGISRIKHTIDCTKDDKRNKTVDEDKYSNREFKNSDKAYECSVCKKQLKLSSIDILKHKKICK